MTIQWDAEARQLHLRNERISYLSRVLENGVLGHLYLGPSLAPGRSYAHLARGSFHGFTNRVGHPVPLEVPTAGSGDVRVPCLSVVHADGSGVLDLPVAGHRISAGKPELPGLPSTYVESADEAETVEIDLVDRVSGLEAVLSLTVFGDLPVIARHLRLRNGGDAPLRVTCLMSASLDLPDHDWRLLTMTGAWAREREPVVRPLVPGRQSAGSLLGASGHHSDPSLILLRPSTTELAGEAIALGLVYSGDFLAEAEVDPMGTTRLRLGLHPEGFEWLLEPGAELTSPEAVIAWSGDGMGDLSSTLHRLYGKRLARGAWRDRPRPVLLNSWEGAYFDFDEERLIRMAAASVDLGVEMFVLDDGWFGARDDDTSSLGDWTVDRRKLPDGLASVARRVNELGLRFGLWIEPEMVNPRSQLFEAHPDWAIGIPGRPRTESRNQLVLDMGRDDVVDHLTDAISAVLASAPIDYVKWDMNRNITEAYSLALPPERQGEMRHRYLLGVYELYRRLTGRFPEVLFESCSGGGGRYDPGMLAFAPQTWASDDTDAVERLRIQWGTSLLYPPSSMGAHVSAVPNHQSGRTTPLAMRAAVAFFGAFGYELDPVALSEADRAEIRAQVAWYLERRELLQFGRFLRLRSPFEGDGNETAWMTVGEGARRAVVGWYRVLARPMPGPGQLRLRGLDPAATYRVSVWPESNDTLARLNCVVRGGDELMSVGLFLDDAPRESAMRGDFQARLFELVADA